MKRVTLRAQYASLTPAQRRVFRRLVRGESAREIATRLGCSPHTVINHTRRVYETFGVHTSGRLLALFIDHSLYSSEDPPRR